MSRIFQKSYCVPFDLVCNGEWECPQGDDEINCKLYSCPNLFKCKNQRKCLHFTKVCDNNKDCVFGDDELWCIPDSLIACPKECKCFAQSLICKHLHAILHQQIFNSTKYLKCISCNLQEDSKLLSALHSIMFLKIKNVLQDSICIQKIPVNYALKHLDISSNRLTKTKNFCFTALHLLTTFHLQQNSISNLEDKSFYLLMYLKLLDLSHNKIKWLKGTLFNGLNNGFNL